MKRISTDAEYLESGKLVVDADGIPFEPASKGYVDQRVPIDSFIGAGSPEGKISAPVGSTYTDTAATAGAVCWIKTSGTGNTGWQVEYGDTGWRDISASFDTPFENGQAIVRRTNSRIMLYFNWARWGQSVVSANLGTAWGGLYNDFQPVSQGGSIAGQVQLSPDGKVTVTRSSVGSTLRSSAIFLSKSSWPSSLIGTPY